MPIDSLQDRVCASDSCTALEESPRAKYKPPRANHDARRDGRRNGDERVAGHNRQEPIFGGEPPQRPEFHESQRQRRQHRRGHSDTARTGLRRHGTNDSTGAAPRREGR